MATVTNGTNGGSTTNTTSYTTASFTPTNGDLLFGIFGVSGSTATDWAPSDSLSGSWEKILRAVKGGSADFVEVWVRTALSDGSALTVTFSHASGNASGCAWNVSRVSGMTLTGSSAIRGSGVEDNLASGATPAPTLSGAALTGNPTVTGVFSTVNGGLNTVPTNWTALSNGNHGTPNATVRQAKRDSGFTGTTITWGSTVNVTHCSWAVEFDTSAGTPHTHSQPDTAAVTDATAKAAGKAQPDTASVTDAQTRAWAAVRTQADTAAVTDNCDPQLTPGSQNWTKDLDDTATVTDTEASTVGKALTDTAGVTDAQSNAAGHTEADTATVTDSATTTSGYVRTQDDTSAVTDARTSSVGKTQADTAAATDSATAAADYERTVADTASVQDANQRDFTGATNWTHTVDDGIAASDQATTTTVYARTVEDAAIAADVLGRYASTALADALVATDVDLRSWQAVANVADTIVVTDDVSIGGPEWTYGAGGSWTYGPYEGWQYAGGTASTYHGGTTWTYGGSP